jgi:hypothetical protein
MKDSKYVVRQMEPRDLPAIWKAAAAQNRRDGTSYPVPPIFDLDENSPRHGKLMPNVALALVTEVNGRVRQGHVWLRTVEEMSFGGDAEAWKFSGAHIPLAHALLRERGYDDVHVLVPKARANALQKMLAAAGLQRIDQRLAHFFRML